MLGHRIIAPVKIARIARTGRASGVRIEQPQIESASEAANVEMERVDHRSAPLSMLALCPVAPFRMHSAADARSRLVDDGVDSGVA